MSTTKQQVAMNLCYLMQDDPAFTNEIILEYVGLVDNKRLEDLLEFSNNEMRANVQRFTSLLQSVTKACIINQTLLYYKYE